MNKTKQHISDKGHFRKLVSESITSMSEREKENESTNVLLKLKKLLSDTSTILIDYLPLSDEVDISKVSEWYTQKGGKILHVPQTLSKIIPQFPENSIILVPGRAFSKKGQRIGRGSGYYDRLVEKNPTLRSIGVCFSCQLFEELPENKWDQRVNEVVFSGNNLE